MQFSQFACSDTRAFSPDSLLSSSSQMPGATVRCGEVVTGHGLEGHRRSSRSLVMFLASQLEAASLQGSSCLAAAGWSLACRCKHLQWTSRCFYKLLPNSAQTVQNSSGSWQVRLPALPPARGEWLEEAGEGLKMLEDHRVLEKPHHRKSRATNAPSAMRGFEIDVSGCAALGPGQATRERPKGTSGCRLCD